MTMTNKWYEPRDARVQAVQFKFSDWQKTPEGSDTIVTTLPSEAPAWLRDACGEGVVRLTLNADMLCDGTLTISNPFLGDHICEPGWFICRAHDGTICACAPEGFALGYVDAESRDDVWSKFERMQGEIAREIRVLLGEEQYDQRIFTDEERARRIEALRKCANEQTSDEVRHASWMQMHLEQGWVYGEEFVPSLKQHPNLKPWAELPVSTRIKARIFNICAQYAKLLAE